MPGVLDFAPILQKYLGVTPDKVGAALRATSVAGRQANLCAIREDIFREWSCQKYVEKPEICHCCRSNYWWCDAEKHQAMASLPSDGTQKLQSRRGAPQISSVQCLMF